MNRPRTTAVLVLFAIGASSYAVPPLVTDDPGTPEKSQFEFFAGFEYLSDGGTLTRQIPALEVDYGLTDRLQLTISLPYFSTGGAEGWGDPVPELKYNFLKDHKTLPDMALTFEWTLPTGSFRRGLGNGASDYFLHLPMQKKWGWFTALADFGYTFIGEPSIDGVREERKNTWFVGFAQKYEVSKKTHLLSELYFRTGDEPGKPNTFAASLGIEQELVKDFDFQCAVTRSLLEGARGGPEARVYVGFHWTFDAPWKHKEDKNDQK